MLLRHLAVVVVLYINVSLTHYIQFVTEKVKSSELQLCIIL